MLIREKDAKIMENEIRKLNNLYKPILEKIEIINYIMINWNNVWGFIANADFGLVKI